jgi:hypothetical protein
MFSNSTLFQKHAEMPAAVLLLQYHTAHFGPESFILLIRQKLLILRAFMTLLIEFQFFNIYVRED